MRDTTGDTDGAGLSYAYALWCHENVDIDTVLVVDKAINAADNPGTGSGTWWSLDALRSGAASMSGGASAVPVGLLNHKNDGVNACYIDGHVRWIPVGKVTELFPNWQNDTDTQGKVRNPL